MGCCMCLSWLSILFSTKEVKGTSVPQRRGTGRGPLSFPTTPMLLTLWNASVSVFTYYFSNFLSRLISISCVAPGEHRPLPPPWAPTAAVCTPAAHRPQRTLPVCLPRTDARATWDRELKLNTCPSNTDWNTGNIKLSKKCVEIHKMTKQISFGWSLS